MAVKVRLMRIGGKGRPFYRVVAVDERKKRTGSYLELLGTYNPLTNPKEINLKQDRIEAWVKNGAQLSDGFLRIIGKAKQHPARKPKKDRGNSASTAPAAAPAEAPAAPAEETSTPVEEPVAAPEQTPEATSAEESAPVAEQATEEPKTEETSEESSKEETPAEEKAE